MGRLHKAKGVTVRPKIVKHKILFGLEKSVPI